MFSKKLHADIKKSTQKIQDSKKDSSTRLKHLKIVLDNVEGEELKNIFDAHFTHIYYILYDSFVTTEINLRQKELSFHLVHKAHRDELDCVLLVLERVLLLLPELLSKRWQWRSLTAIMTRLLHPGNTAKLRRESIRYFLLWYQTLGENAPACLDGMFATLVPGFPTLGDLISNSGSLTGGTSVFHDSIQGPVCPIEPHPLLPPQSGDKQPEDPTRFYLEALLEFIVTQVTRIEWRDRSNKQHKCFNFLFDRFKQFYLPHVFPDLSKSTSLYKPNLELPELRKQSSKSIDDPFLPCRVAVIKWIATYTHVTKKDLSASALNVNYTQPVSSTSVTPSEEATTPNSELRRVSVSQAPSQQLPHNEPSPNLMPDSSGSPVSSAPTSLHFREPGSLETNLHETANSAQLVRDILYSSRDNVDLVHEIYRQSFLLGFQNSPAIRKAIGVYKDWIQMNVPELPVFMLEPLEYKDDIRSGPPSFEMSSIESCDGTNMSESNRITRLRNDSYLGAIHRENLIVRAGLQNVLQVFTTHAANVFLLEVNPVHSHLLEEQVDICKRVLNIYRYMVMHTRMDPQTWEQLLLVLLQITSLILSKTPPKRKDETLGGKIAPAIFQTVIVTWIKANVNVIISSELWDQFLHVLSTLTQWEELIREWAKTLETLTRVLARHVYNVDLTDLPLDRLTELSKAKKRKGAGGNQPPGRQISCPANNIGSSDSTSVTRNVHQSSTRSISSNGACSTGGASSGNPSGVITGSVSASNVLRTLSSTSAGVVQSVSGLSSSTGIGGIHRSLSGMSRSISESNLAMGRREASQRRRRAATSHSQHQSSRPSSSTVVQELPLALEQELNKIISKGSSGSLHTNRLHRKAHSLDSLPGTRAILNQTSESEGPTRTPSPAPSSGVESNSIKDSPMQLDMLAGDATSLELTEGASGAAMGGVSGVSFGGGSGSVLGSNTMGNSSLLSSNSMSLERRSVMAGGTVAGWLPDVAVVLWRRMLGSLGDVNILRDPRLHAQLFNHLVDLCDTLVKIRQNQGVSGDNQITPPPPELVPPLNIVAPWCFKALTLPDSYQKGKLNAYRLLCLVTVSPQDIPPPKDHLTQFYKVLHEGLIGTDQSIINTLVRHCGAEFFSVMLPGHTLLFYDFIHAANTVVCSHDLKTTPRTEATTMLGCLLSLSDQVADLPVLQPTPNQFTLMHCSETKEHVLTVLLRRGKEERTAHARCIALSSLGIFVYQELAHRTFHPRLKEALNVILLALKQKFGRSRIKVHLETTEEFKQQTVGQVSCDILLLLCDQAQVLMEQYPELPARIIHVLAIMLTSLASSKDTLREKHRITSLIFCLGEWCMHVPVKCLLDREKDNSLLLTVFKVLNQLMEGKSVSGGVSSAGDLVASGLFTAEMVRDFDPEVILDDLQDDSTGLLSPSPMTSSTNSNSHSEHSQGVQAIQMAAKMVSMHLLNHLDHFPMLSGAARLSSMVVEHDDVPDMSSDELSDQVFKAPNIQLLVMNNSLLVSLVELPALEAPGGGATAGLRTASSQVRVILRSLSGKACWDASILYCSPEAGTCRHHGEERPYPVAPPRHRRSDASMTPSMMASLVPPAASPPMHTLRHRDAQTLPTFENGAPDMDNLDDLLQYIGHTSPECLEALDTPLNAPAPAPSSHIAQLEDEMLSTVLSQRNAELDYLGPRHCENMLTGESIVPPSYSPPPAAFQHCRLLFSQLGLAGWERRAHLHLLSKNEKLLRELRNLDSQRCRETHKIAVIYVAEGQEDKNSILSNASGSQAFEDFIAGLAWEVELESHTGFLGGLQRNKTTGDTAPYFATSFLEVIFHVSTRMPSHTQEALLNKTRHLGNDEVHIVWSEHTRPYRRGILPTEFCDVLITIYPLPNKMCRVNISRKPEVPYFGPLFNEAIVDQTLLPGLVRATALSASRAKRSMLPFYQNYYEERAKSLETVVRNHKTASSFEDFAAQVYSPVQLHSPFVAYHPRTAPGTGGVTRAAVGCHKQNKDFVSGGGGSGSSGRVPASSTLAAALLDSGHQSFLHHDHRLLSRGHDVRVWFGGGVCSGRDTSSESSSGGTLHGISPRPLKKLSFKSPAARKSYNAMKSSDISSTSILSSSNLIGIGIGGIATPPDSPIARKK